MRYLPFVYAVVILAAGTTTGGAQSELQTAACTHVLASEPDRALVDSVLQFLLTAAASDFRVHGPSGPLRFREVRLGHVMSPGAEIQYRLCGQFLRAQRGIKSRWTRFVTIKTSGYEQYVGLQARAFCRGSSIVWDDVGDVSSLLQSRFDSLR